MDKQIPGARFVCLALYVCIESKKNIPNANQTELRAKSDGHCGVFESPSKPSIPSFIIRRPIKTEHAVDNRLRLDWMSSTITNKLIFKKKKEYTLESQIKY